VTRTTPFHARTGPLCTSFAWKEWAGYAAVCNYDRHSEREYYAFRQTAGIIDMTPLSKLEVRGPDAGAFLARLWTRDIRRLPPGRVVYGAMCDGNGHVLDDGTVANLGKNHYRVSSNAPWLGWYLENARRFDVDITESAYDIGVLSIQGPLARDLLNPIVEADLDVMRFFGVRSTKIAGISGEVARTGYTGDLGFECWVANDDAPALWDAVLEAGKLYGAEPAGLDAMDVARIEAGFVLPGIDYISARDCVNETRKSTPDEAGLGWTVKLDREDWIGRDALVRERDRGGSKWLMVGLEVSWPDLEALYDEYKLPPHLAPCGCRETLPVYDQDGRQVGQATSSTWSPILKRYIAMAQVHRPFGGLGTRLKIEHTVEFERRQVTATVVEKPFYDPPQKTFTPKKLQKSAPNRKKGDA